MSNPPRQDPLPLTANQPGEWHCPGCDHREHQPSNVRAVWHPCPSHGNRPQPLQPNPQTRETRHDR